MSIFSMRRCKSRSAKSGNEKPPHRKMESNNFPEENSHKPRNLSQKTRNGRLPKKLVSKSKKLELKSTTLELKSKKTRSDCAKKPDPSISSGLKVKNKTIRVMPDSGSSGDLLFMKKGSSKRISIAKRVVLQSWGTLPMAPSSQTGWATLKSLLWSTLPARRFAFSQIL